MMNATFKEELLAFDAQAAKLTSSVVRDVRIR